MSDRQGNRRPHCLIDLKQVLLLGDKQARREVYISYVACLSPSNKNCFMLAPTTLVFRLVDY